MGHRSFRLLPLLLMTFYATGCSQHHLFDSALIEQPKIAQSTQSARLLASLPPAKEPVVVSAYDFQDMTGQLKPNTQYAEYSRAVTQGGLPILNKALLKAGRGRWFTVVERGGLRDLLEERQIISTMRGSYAGPDGQPLGKLPPLLYAGMLIEGGIVGYDSNVVTGGSGAQYLGIGGNVTHQRDIVTVELRAVNVANGQVMLSVTSEKTIYSTGIQGNVFKYVSLDHLLEAETGFTMNEPPQLAVRQAIETAVYQLIMEGVREHMWQFADEAAGKAAMADYLKRVAEDSHYTPPPPPPTPEQKVAPVLSQQVPATAQPTSPGALQAEKKTIVNSVPNYAPSDDTAPAPTPDSNQPLQYPPVPANARRTR